MSEGPINEFERALCGQIWDNLSTKIVNDIKNL